MFAAPAPARPGAWHAGVLAAGGALLAASAVLQALMGIVGVACTAFGAAPYTGAGRSPHALGYVLAGALVVAGAGRARP